MEFIKVSVDEHISYIVMDRGKSNAINQQMLAELNEVITSAQRDPAIEGIVLQGKEGFFSAGLDLIALYEYNEEETRLFWQAFIQLVHTFAAFDKPAVASISGHSPAG